MAVDSLKRPTPKPIEQPTAPSTSVAARATAAATAAAIPASSYTPPQDRLVTLSPPQGTLSSGAPTIRSGSAALLESSIQRVAMMSDVKKDLSGLFGGGISGPKPSNAPENQPVTRDMTADERKAYDKLAEPDRATFNEAHLAAQASQEPAAVEKLEVALASGAMPEYLSLPPEERERVDQLYAATENLPPDQQREARAQVANLVKEGKVDEYMAVEQNSAQGENLQALLFSGQLNGMSEAPGGPTMLDELSTFLAENETDPDGMTDSQINRRGMVDQIIQDVAENPYDQPEGNRDCGPLAVIGEFAGRSPATYARAMTELAETGQTTVHDAEGNAIELKYAGPYRPPAEGEDALSVTQEVFVSAFGDYIDRTYGREGTGNMLRDLINRAVDGVDGMNSFEIAQLREIVSGEDYEAMTIPDNEEIDPNDPAQVEQQRALQAEAKETIQEQLDAGEKPVVLIDGHWVQVENAITLGGVTFYVIDDGTGKPRFAGVGSIDAVVYNTEHSDVPAGSYNADWDDPGTGGRPLGGDPDDGG